MSIVGAFGFVQTTEFFYASDLAQNTYGWSGRFTVIVVTAGVFGIFGFVLGGHFSDIVGRKPMVALANVLAFPLRARRFSLWPRRPELLRTVRLAYATELFPTELRATVAPSSPARVLVTTSPPSTPGGRSSRTGALRIRG